MKKNLYSVYDCVSCLFDTPFSAVNHLSAIRAFRDTAMHPDSFISQHPSDFELYFLGTFDAEVGSLIPANRVVLARGDDKVERGGDNE